MGLKTTIILFSYLSDKINLQFMIQSSEPMNSTLYNSSISITVKFLSYNVWDDCFVYGWILSFISYTVFIKYK